MSVYEWIALSFSIVALLLSGVAVYLRSSGRKAEAAAVEQVAGELPKLAPKKSAPPLLPLSSLCLAGIVGVCGGASFFMLAACGPSKHPCVTAYEKASTKEELAEVDKTCGHMLLPSASAKGGE